MDDFARRLTALMAERSLGVRALAREIPCDPALISRYVNDKQRPSLEMAQHLDDVLAAGGELVARAVQREQATAAVPIPGQSVENMTYLANWIDAMERRSLLILAGLGAVAPWAATESLRAALTRIAGTSDSVGDWQATVTDYATTMPFTPVKALLPDLLTDLNEVGALIEARHPEQQALLQVAAALSAFTAMATYDSGYPSRAFRWWRTAQGLADRSEYAPLRTWVRARHGADLLYGRKLTGPALRLADDALRLTGSQPSEATAEAHALRAIALANDGDPRARESLDELSAVIDCLPAGGEIFTGEIGGWHDEERLRGTRTWVLVKLGNGTAAHRAGEASRRPFNQMGVALALALEGRADDAIGHAVSVLAALSGAEDRLSVREKGYDVLAAVPPRTHALPAARELRALSSATVS